MKEIIRRSMTGVSLVVLFAGSILWGPVPFLIMILGLYGLCIAELVKLLSLGGHKPCGQLILAGGLVILFVFLGLQYHLQPLWLILPAGLWIGGNLRMRSPGVSSLYMLWLAVPLASFLALGWVNGSAGYRSLVPLSVIILVWNNDIFAYLTGSLLGRHQMTPRLSPGKTWEGFAGGILFNLVAGYLLFLVTGTLHAGIWILSGGLVSMLAVTGDLFESHLKRKYRVKDTGKLLPGHGGILDRFDSLLLVSPVILIVIMIYHSAA